MNIHELYKQKQEAYQKYTVELEFHKKAIAEKMGQLSSRLNELKRVATGLEDGEIKQGILQVAADLQGIENPEEQHEQLIAAETKMKQLEEMLSSEIERLLNE